MITSQDVGSQSILRQLHPLSGCCVFHRIAWHEEVNARRLLVYRHERPRKGKGMNVNRRHMPSKKKRGVRECGFSRRQGLMAATLAWLA